jgi:hypothetical protein
MPSMQIRKSSLLKSAEQVNWLECSSDVHFPNCVKAPPSVVSGYGKRSINLNKVVANFEKHIFLSQTDLTRTGIISNCYNENTGR